MIDTIETTNGHAKGRAVPPLPAFTFPDSGITVHVPRLSPNTQALIAEQVLREMPARPEPPIQTVEGLDGKAHDEPNAANPEYLAELRAWTQSANIEIGARFRQLVMRRLVVEVDADAVQALRDRLATARGCGRSAAVSGSRLYQQPDRFRGADGVCAAPRRADGGGHCRASGQLSR
jgi:hypothetical protein